MMRDEGGGQGGGEEVAGQKVRRLKSSRFSLSRHLSVFRPLSQTMAFGSLLLYLLLQFRELRLRLLPSLLFTASSSSYALLSMLRFEPCFLFSRLAFLLNEVCAASEKLEARAKTRLERDFPGLGRNENRKYNDPAEF